MIQLAAIFERAVGARLGEAERLVLNWPTLFPTGLKHCDLAFRATTRSFLAVAHFEDKQFGPDTEARFGFWASRSGGRSLSTYLLGADERAVFERQFSLCDLHEMGVTPDKLPEAMNRLSAAIGVPEGRRQSPRHLVQLEVDLGDAGGTLLTEDISQGGVFVVSDQLLPLGDKFQLKLSIPGFKEPFQVEVRVAHARTAASRAKGPQGFGLQFLSAAPELSSALEKFFTARADSAARQSRRKSVRHAVHAPVRLTPQENLRPTETRPAPPSSVSLRYDDAQSAREDYLKNLSHGGAFIRSTLNLPIRTRVMLDIRFPKDLSLSTPGEVVHTQHDGMGIQFQLDAEGRESLDRIIDQLTTVPRRVLLVDEEAKFRGILTAALRRQGFDVLEADTASGGLNTLLEELFNLDVVIARDSLSPIHGQSLFEVVRRAGGENELALLLLGDLAPPAASFADVMLPSRCSPDEVAQRALNLWEKRRERSGP